MKALYDADGRYNRIFEIDFIRGLCILLVMFDHLMYNFAICYASGEFFIEMNWLARSYWYWDVRIYVRYVVIAIFFLISGISSSFSKNNTVRGLKVVGVAAVLTLVTYVGYWIMGSRSVVIDFGVIHVFGFSILIYSFISGLKSRWIILLGGISFFLAWYIPTLEIVTTSLVLLPIGVTPVGYVYGDYFSMFPWIGFFFIGGVLGRVFYPQRKSLMGGISPRISKPILHIGRKSMYYYFGEMIVLMPIFYGIEYFF